MVRFIPGVLGHEQSAAEDSYEKGQLDYPHYTRPEVFEGKKVPEVLLSGNHQKIEAWRKQRAEDKTNKIYPNLKGKGCPDNPEKIY